MRSIHNRNDIELELHKNLSRELPLLRIFLQYNYHLKTDPDLLLNIPQIL